MTEELITTLRDGNISTKVDAIVKINEILGLERNAPLLEEMTANSNRLLGAFGIVLADTFNRPPSEIPVRFAKYFLDVLHNVCQSKCILREVDEENMFVLCE